MKAKWVLTLIFLIGLVQWGLGSNSSASYQDVGKNGAVDTLESIPYIREVVVLRFEEPSGGKKTVVNAALNVIAEDFGSPIQRVVLYDSLGDSYEIRWEDFFAGASQAHVILELPFWLPEGDVRFIMYDEVGVGHEFPEPGNDPNSRFAAGSKPSLLGDFSGADDKGFRIDLKVLPPSLSPNYQINISGTVLTPRCGALLYSATQYSSTSSSTHQFTSGSYLGVGLTRELGIRGTYNNVSDYWYGQWQFNDSTCGSYSSGRGWPYFDGSPWRASRFFRPVAIIAFSPREGTIGTAVAMTGTGFGASPGKIFVGQAKTKITAWTSGSAQFLLAKPPLSGVYDVTIAPKEPKGVTSTVLPAYFTVKLPEISSLSKSSGVSGEQVSITGKFFGTKKGSVSLTDIAGKKYKCKVISWIMDPATNEGSIIFSVPKKVFGDCDLTVTNKIGSFTRISGFTVP